MQNSIHLFFLENDLNEIETPYFFANFYLKMCFKETSYKKKERQKKIIKWKSLKILIFAHAQAKNFIKWDASGKKGVLSCCKCRFE